MVGKQTYIDVEKEYDMIQIDKKRYPPKVVKLRPGLSKNRWRHKPVPKARPRKVGVLGEVELIDGLEFVQAPRKVQASQQKTVTRGIPSNLRTGLTIEQRKQLAAYSGSAQAKRAIEIYLLRDVPFDRAVMLALSQQRAELMPRVRKPKGLPKARGRGGARFLDDTIGNPLHS